MKKQEVYTVKQAAEKLKHYCAYRERCHREVETKLNSFPLSEVEKQEVISILIAENFLNEERFAKIFAADKFNLQSWGKNRIIRELKQRDISAYLIGKALLEIDEEAYLQTFEKLFRKKSKSISETDPFKKNKKLLNYLRYKGFEYELIISRLNQND